MSVVAREGEVGGGRRLRLPNLSHSTYDALFGWTYALFATNVSLVLANLPLVAVLFTVVDPLASWPVLLVLGLTVAPSLGAAFAVFRAEAEEAAHAPFRAFWRGYRDGFRRSALVGLVAVATVGVAIADLVFLGAGPLAPFAVPFFAVLVVVALAVTVTTLAGLRLRPEAGTAVLARVAFALTVRRWFLALLSVAALLFLAAVALVQPVLGTLIAPAPLLFLVWSNAQVAFARV